MSNHDRTTTIRRPVIREIPPAEDGDRSIMVRMDEDGVQVWPKRSRRRFHVTFPELLEFAMKLARKRAREVERVALWRNDRKWARFFIRAKTAGHTNASLAAYCQEQGLRQDDGRAWSWAAIEQCVDREIRRLARRQADQAEVQQNDEADRDNHLPRCDDSVTDS